MSITPLLLSPPLLCDTWSQQISDVTSTFLTAQFAARKMVSGEREQVEKASARRTMGKRKRSSASQALARACRDAPASIFADTGSTVRSAVSLAAWIPAGARGAAALLQMAVMSCDAGQGDVRLPVTQAYSTKAHEAFALPEPRH